jgi:hypothetical protein
MGYGPSMRGWPRPLDYRVDENGNYLDPRTAKIIRAAETADTAALREQYALDLVWYEENVAPSKLKPDGTRLP